jgi:hypothetical protein
MNITFNNRYLSGINGLINLWFATVSQNVGNIFRLGESKKDLKVK